MKNFLFILSVFIFFNGVSSGQTFSCTAENSTKLSVTSRQEKSASSLSQSTGTSISFSPSPLFNSKLGAYCSWSDFLQSKDDYSLKWAGAITFFKNTPVTLKGGMLGFTKSFSRLKNPVFSPSATAVNKSFSFSTGLTATTPTLSSATKQLSFFMGLDLLKTIFPFQMGGFYCQDGTSFCSGGTKLYFSRSSFFQLQLSLGRFFLSSNSTVLKKNNISFDEDWYLAGSIESALIFPSFKWIFYGGFNESPWEVKSLWIRSRIRLITGSFLWDFSYFAIPTESCSPRACPLISADSTLIKTVEQAEINPQAVFFMGESTLTCGLSASETWKLAGTSVVSTLNTLRFNGTILLEKQLSSFKLNLTGDNILLSGIPPSASTTPQKYFGISLTSRRKFKLLNLGTSLNAKQYPPSTRNSNLLQKISCSIDGSSTTKIPVTARAGASFTLQNGTKSAGELNFGAGAKVKTKGINSIFRVNLKLEI